MKTLLIGLAIFTFFAWELPSAGTEQKVVFLDVGQGDSILMQDGSNQILLDGGPGMKVLEELGKQMSWFDRRIEVVILSHPQEDHMEGLLHVIDRYQVGLVVIPKVATDTLMQQEWIKKIEGHRVPWRFAWAGQRITAGDIELNILHPFDGEVAAKNVNDASVVARVDFGKKDTEGRRLSFLLTGDAEKKVENMLIARTDPSLLDVDVLKAGHHGSKTSTIPAMVNVTTPQAAVVSVGADNKFGHPAMEVLDRLKNIPVWRTDIDGAVEFFWSKGEWRVRTGN